MAIELREDEVANRANEELEERVAARDPLVPELLLVVVVEEGVEEAEADRGVVRLVGSEAFGASVAERLAIVVLEEKYPIEFLH